MEVIRLLSRLWVCDPLLSDRDNAEGTLRSVGWIREMQNSSRGRASVWNILPHRELYISLDPAS